MSRLLLGMMAMLCVTLVAGQALETLHSPMAWKVAMVVIVLIAGGAITLRFRNGKGD